MEQQERLAYLIDRLIDEDPRWAHARAAGELTVPRDAEERYRLYRSLVNVRPPRAVDAAYLEVEDAYLQERVRAQGSVGLPDIAAAVPAGLQAAADEGLYLWQGDICRLELDAIVNAANSQMLGCFMPCHGCIDNAIHTAAGVRLRLACDALMEAQGAPEPTGAAQVTPGFNLPAAHVIHTVGPIVGGPRPSARDRAQLASCYRSCLDAAADRGLASIAFCCISTGEFHFPNRAAAQIALGTVRSWRAEAAAAGRPSPVVVFNVFKDLDYRIYQELLGGKYA